MTRPSTQPTVPSELGEQLDHSDGLRVRAAWFRSGESAWHLRLLEIIDDEAPQIIQDQEWAYPSVAFHDRRVSGELIGSWFKVGTVTTGRGWQHPLVGPTDRLNWERLDSFSTRNHQVLEWPCYEVQLGHFEMNEPQRPLFSDQGAPSFASFHQAAACFFGLSSSLPAGTLPSSAVYRRVDRRARITRVHLSDNQLRIDVEGIALDGLTIELAGDEPGVVHTLAESGTTATVSFPLIDGLPAGAWVVVRAGSEWLDRRFLASPWGRGQAPGFTVELPASTKIEAFLAARENDTVEYKQSIPDVESTRASVMKTVCAFSNGSGGSLLFGITDDHEAVGVPGAKAGRYKDTLSELIDAWIEPTPSYEFDVLQIEGTDMIVLERTVNAGLALFGSSKPNEPRRVYVRHYSRSVPARVREIEDISRRRSDPAQFLRRYA